MLLAGSMISCVIHGYHIYKEVWCPYVGENFMCFDGEDNVHDRKPVAVTCSGRFVVGHLLHEISSLVHLFVAALASCLGLITII